MFLDTCELSALESSSLVKKALKDALILIEKGWCKRYGDGEIRFCPVEAIYRVTPELHFSEVYNAIVKHMPPHWMTLIAYNDAKETTKADIIGLFLKAIENA